ncbi:CapA family protein, partial [Streptomyces hydrogenans]
ADAGDGGYDFRPMLAGVKPVVSGADLALCHMETVYGKDGGPYTGYPAFKSPPEVAAALAATGYDSCSTASNHTLDDGAAGLGRTLDAL